MDRDDTPCALHAELLEESCGNDGVGLDEGVRIKQCSTDNAHDDDGEATAENLRAVANDGSASNRTQISHDLGDCNGIGAEFELVGEHGRIEILRTV